MSSSVIGGIKPSYLEYLQEKAETLTTVDGLPIRVMELIVPSDEPCLNDWASRFRQHYCLDSELDDLCEGTGKTKAEYLVELVFPNKSTSPGPWRVNQNGGWNFKQPFWIPHFPPHSCPETNDRRFFANRHLRPVLSFVKVNVRHVASNAFAAFSQNVY